MSYTFDEYSAAAESTAFYPGYGTQSVESAVYLALGASGELGEIQGKLKKVMRDLGVGYNQPVPAQAREAILAEVGDVLWYLNMLSLELGSDLGSCASYNANKLYRRALSGTLRGSGDTR